MVDCCGHRFCKACIERVLADFKSCPLCNHRQPKVIADRQLSRTLREKRVRCTHKGEGCKWVGVLSTLDEHLDATSRVDGCRLRHMHCSYCRSLFCYDVFANHKSICPRKPVICEYIVTPISACDTSCQINGRSVPFIQLFAQRVWRKNHSPWHG